MGRYAERTTVTVDKSRVEIERTLARYGADQFAYGWDDARAMIGFRMHGRNVRFLLPMPDRQASEYTLTPTGLPRAETEAQRLYDQALRQRWRALALAVKAKLEVVEAGIAEFEDEFLAYILIPGTSRTMGEWAKPELEQAYEQREAPQLALPRGDG